MGIDWVRSSREVNAALDRYADSVDDTVKVVADIFATVIEGYAKQHAPWQDDTGAARQNLHAYAEEMAEGVIGLLLQHGVHYGLFLETAHAGKMATVWPTIEKHLPEIEQALMAIFEDR